MAKSFGTWLKRQAHRDDWIGDLAQDFIQDLRSNDCIKPRPSRWTPDQLKSRLNDLHACDGAFEALEAAEAEWRSMA